VGRAVSLLGTFWDTYVGTYNVLADNWAQHVPAPAARRVARRSLARLVQLAGVGWETQNGPYAEALDLGVGMALTEGFKAGKDSMGAIESKVIVPPDALMCGLGWAYAVVYQAAVLAQWTFVEREELALRLRMIDPVAHDQLWIKAHLFNPADGLPFLRRAFDVLELHDCDNELICRSTIELRDEEEAKGLRWAIDARRLEVSR
jgi:hypothetical protein